MGGYVEPAAPAESGAPFPGWASLDMLVTGSRCTLIGVDALRRGWIGLVGEGGAVQWDRIPEPGEKP